MGAYRIGIYQHKLGDEQIDNVQTVHVSTTDVISQEEHIRISVELRPEISWTGGSECKPSEGRYKFSKDKIHNRKNCASSYGSSKADQIKRPGKSIGITENSLNYVSNRSRENVSITYQVTFHSPCR